MGFGGVQAVIGSFGARLGLDTTDYARGHLVAQGLHSVFGQTFSTFVANPLLGSIQIFKQVSQVMLSWSSQVLDTAESVAVFAAEINASTDFVQALKAQYEAVGQSFEASKPTLKEIVANIREARDAASPTARALAEIGVSLEGVTDTGEAVERIVAGINRVESAARRTQLAFQLLSSRTGGEFLAVVGSSTNAIREMEERARALGLVMDQETLATMGELDDQLDDIQQALQGIKQTATAGFLRGFASEFLDGAAGVEGFAQAINGRVEPAAERLGQQVGELVGNLDTILTRLEAVARVVDGLADNWFVKQIGQGLEWGGAVASGEVFSMEFARGLDVALAEHFGGADAGRAEYNRLLNQNSSVRDVLRRTGAGPR